MPAADQGHTQDVCTRSSGAADPQPPPPMQEQQWHPHRDTGYMPKDNRYTIYSDDQRVVAQTSGAWGNGPRTSEVHKVAAMIAAAPIMAAALRSAEAHLRKLIEEDPKAGVDGMRSKHYAAWSYAKIALSDLDRCDEVNEPIRYPW